MRESTVDPFTSSRDEYIKRELKSDSRYVLYNGHFIEQRGEKANHNRSIGLTYIFFMKHLDPNKYQVYTKGVKISGPDRNHYFYPDLFITAEAENEYNQHIKYEPELIVEVLSPSTHITDRVNKFLVYTAIPSLKYYLIVEPETVYVTCYSKNDEAKWEAMSYVRKTDVIPLPLLDVSLPLSEVYK